MTISDAQKKATQKYKAKAYDEIKLYVPKGQRETINQKAISLGMSKNEFINQAINYALENDIIEPKEKG